VDDMNFELESDMKAAKISDVKWVYGTDKNKIYYEPLNGEPAWEEFTLSDPATRDAVVQMLGEKYGVCIFHTHPDFPAQGWVAENAINGWESDIYESRTECIRHAVMEVKDDRSH